jgi:Fn3 associated
MKTTVSGMLFKAWAGGSRFLSLRIAALLMLVAGSLFGQATVTTLTDAHHGKPGYKDGSTFYYAQFRNPMAIALDSSGQNMFVADNLNNAVRWISNLGNDSSSYTLSIYTNKNGISAPVDIAVDATTNIYVLNRGNGINGTILEFNGFLSLNYNVTKLVATNATKLINATAMALDRSGKIYVAISSNTVICVNPGGSIQTVGIISVPKTWLRGMTLTTSGQLAITDGGNNGIWLMDPSNTNIYNNALQLTGFNGPGDALGPPAYSKFNRPEKIAAAGGGYLVVADYNNNKVKVIDASGNVTRLFGVSSKYWYGPYKGWSANGLSVNPNEQADKVMARQPCAVTVAFDGSVYDSEIYYELIRYATGTGLPALPPPPPSAPTIWSVTTNLLLDQVTITWSAVSGATNYYVKRAQDSPTNNYQLIATTSGTSYTDTIQEGVNYYYEVSAVNTGGESPNSAPVGVILPYSAAPDPQIGYITYPDFTNSVFNKVSLFVMNSPMQIVIKEPLGFPVNYAFAATSTNPAPTTFPYSANDGYEDGLDPATVGSQFDIYNIIQQYPDVTIWAQANGGITNIPNSSIIKARFVFITADPNIAGTNAAEFTITDPITPGAYFYYTLDGSDPSPTNGIYVPANQVTNSISIVADTLIKVRAYYANYQPSDVVSNLFTLANYKPNQISFGFAAGPGSSKLVASPGQSFVLPISLDLLDTAPPVYGLQFNITVTNLGSHAVAPGDVTFESMLGKPDPFESGYFDVIPTFAFIGNSQPYNDPFAIQYQGNWYQSLQFEDTNNFNLLGVGWLEVYGQTNLYNTLSQTLLSHPLADGTDLIISNNQMVIGKYAFGIPANADPTDIYQVQIARASATTYPFLGSFGVPVPIDSPANTNLVGPGSESALKNITIGQIKYLVGDVYPANWYNAGDFGSSNLVNVDVSRVFEFAAYQNLIAPPPAYSDLYDALDSCGNFGVFDPNNGYYTNPVVFETFYGTNSFTEFDTNGVPVAPTTLYVTTNVFQIYTTTYQITVPQYATNLYDEIPPIQPTNSIVDTSYSVAINPVLNLFDGNETNIINQMAFGDGVLDICDVYVTYRRSLDSTLLWYERFWTNGTRAADTQIHNHAAKIAGKSATSNTSIKSKVLPKSSVPPQVTFTAGSISTSPGKTVKIPITVNVQGSYPLRLLLLNLSVVPLNGAPVLSKAITFTQSASVLGTPYTTASVGNGNYSAVWLNRGNSGITGTYTIGSLTVSIPANAPTSSAYGIFFDHASASPNGLVSFPKQTVAGSISLSK